MPLVRAEVVLVPEVLPRVLPGVDPPGIRSGIPRALLRLAERVEDEERVELLVLVAEWFRFMGPAPAVAGRRLGTCEGDRALVTPARLEVLEVPLVPRRRIRVGVPLKNEMRPLVLLLVPLAETTAAVVASRNP